MLVSFHACRVPQSCFSNNQCKFNLFRCRSQTQAGQIRGYKAIMVNFGRNNDTGRSPGVPKNQPRGVSHEVKEVGTTLGAVHNKRAMPPLLRKIDAKCTKRTQILLRHGADMVWERMKYAHFLRSATATASGLRMPRVLNIAGHHLAFCAQRSAVGHLFLNGKDQHNHAW